RTRLYIEAMEEILPRLKKYIVDTGGETPVDLGFLEEK
ncbi:MAG: FtsH protease activity modulator HflK, partial [Deltaproteobacteria bacterium]|nr:FtsH protease activity modulator HflK [Deltaproteobacteria bacterium]